MNDTTVHYYPPVNPPGTPRSEQRCQFCRISLSAYKERHRCLVSKDDDYARANVCMYCEECRKEKVGKLDDAEFLKPENKWRRICYHHFEQAGDKDGFWAMTHEIQPFGVHAFDPVPEEIEDEK